MALAELFFCCAALFFCLIFPLFCFGMIPRVERIPRWRVVDENEREVVDAREFAPKRVGGTDENFFSFLENLFF